MAKKVGDSGTRRSCPPLPSEMNTRHSPRRRSESRRPEHLAAPEPSEHHGLGHGPVPLGAQRAHERLDLVGVEDPGQPAHPAHERQTASAARAALAGGDAPGTGLAVDVDVVAGDQVAIEARDRGQPALDRRRRQPGGAVGDAHHVLGTGPGRRCAVTKAITSLGVTSMGLLVHHREEHAQVVGVGPHGVGTGPADHELQELVDQLVADPVLALTVRTDVTLEDGLHSTAHLRVGLHPRRLPRMPSPGGGSPV